MIQLVLGTIDYGRVDGYDREYAVTSYAHVWLLPIWAIESSWIGPGGAMPIRLHARSAIAGFVRWWGPIVALGALAGVLYGGPSLLFGISGAAALACAWTWRWGTLRGELARRRAALNRAAFGSSCDVRRRRDGRAGIAAKLEARWAELATGRSPADVAERGARSVDEAACAYGLLELDGSRAARADADRIARGAVAASSIDGPYRAGAEPRIDAAAELSAGPAAMISPAERRRLEDRTRLEFAGLVLLSLCAVFGAYAFAHSFATPPLLTASELAIDPPIGLTVRVPCELVTVPCTHEITAKVRRAKTGEITFEPDLGQDQLAGALGLATLIGAAIGWPLWLRARRRRLAVTR
jgi:hypothetical protein